MGTLQRELPLCGNELVINYNISQAEYKWLNSSDNLIIYDPVNTELNGYHGGEFLFPPSQAAKACANYH